jgi:hypothetical protein
MIEKVMPMMKSPPVMRVKNVDATPKGAPTNN